MYAGVAVTGVVGRTYEIQATTNVNDSNSWSAIAAITLPGFPQPFLYFDLASVDASRRFYRAVDRGNAPENMAFIPSSSFTMGDPFVEGATDERPAHPVNVSAFWMDRFEVTKALWDDVRTWALANGYQFDLAGAGAATNHPVQTVNWYDAVKWCNARSQKSGLSPVYYTDAAFATVYKVGQVNLAASMVRRNATGFRLPTETEWEKAARGGLTGHHFTWFSSGTNGYTNYIIDANANYIDSGDPFEGANTKTTPVGYYNGQQIPAGQNMANGYGLYDMAGNVWEWCWDWYDSSWYSNGSATQSDSRGPVGPLAYRVLRGGAWYNATSHLRCATRSGNNSPTYSGDTVGFRCVRGL